MLELSTFSLLELLLFPDRISWVQIPAKMSKN